MQGSAGRYQHPPRPQREEIDNVAAVDVSSGSGEMPHPGLPKLARQVTLADESRRAGAQLIEVIASGGLDGAVGGDVLAHQVRRQQAVGACRQLVGPQGDGAGASQVADKPTGKGVAQGPPQRPQLPALLRAATTHAAIIGNCAG